MIKTLFRRCAIDSHLTQQTCIQVIRLHLDDNVGMSAGKSVTHISFFAQT